MGVCCSECYRESDWKDTLQKAIDDFGRLHPPLAKDMDTAVQVGLALLRPDPKSVLAIRANTWGENRIDGEYQLKNGKPQLKEKQP